MTWVALLACVGILAVAWVMTDALGGAVAVPLLMALMSGGLLIAREKTAPGAAIVAGVVVSAHGLLLLVEGGRDLLLLLSYLICGVVLLVCGATLRATARGTEAPTAEA